MQIIRNRMTGVITITDGDYRTTIENVGGMQAYSWNVYCCGEYVKGSRAWDIVEAQIRAADAIHSHHTYYHPSTLPIVASRLAQYAQLDLSFAS